MEKKKAVIYSTVALIALVILVVGATYAYFQNQYGSASNADVNVTTYTTDVLTFETGDAINITADQESFAQGKGNRTGSTFSRATLQANNKTNTATANYYVYLNISGNDFEYSKDSSSSELLLSITDNSGNQVTKLTGLNYITVTDGSNKSVSGFDITKSSGLLTLIDNKEISASPKKIEEIILEVKDRKGEINNTLLLKDLDSSQYGDNGYWDEDGNYIPGIDPDLDNDNVVKNAYCKKFVPYDYEDITVELTDCDGNQQESVNFKDYIIGTVKGEIDNYSNKNYALTQMIANINFALQRRGNQNKLKSGSKIKMRNGDCDQVFSSKKGSYKHTANLVCIEETGQKCVNYYQGSAPLNEEGYTNYKGPMSDAEYKEYEKLYEIAKNYLVIKDGRIFETGYVADVSIKWEAEANAGKNYIQILKETYGDVDIIECSGADGGYEGGYDPSLARKGCAGIVEAAAREVGASNGLKYIHWFNATFNMDHKDSVAWCAIFASWVGYKTGYDGTQVTMTAGADAMLQGFRNRGKGHKKGYVPKAGDYVFFDYERKNDAGEVVQPQDGVADHVAIVRSYDPNTHQVCTIGGNEGNSVKNNNCFGYTDGSVLGYGEIDCKENNKKGDNRKDEIK